MPEITQTQDEFKIGSIDLVHINPSIMEGERFYPTLLGPGAAIPIVRYAPTFLVDPSITGDFKIPSVLTCNPGVIDASPQATIFYQWQADGVDIPGETTNKFTTSLELDKVEITCDVDAVNILGVDSGSSNGITAEIVEPIVNHENVYFALTGLNQEMQQNAMTEKTMVITGASTIERLDVQQDIVYMGSGMWVETRTDTNSATVAMMTGLNAPNRDETLGHEAYVIWQPTYLGDLAIVNPGAETGDLTGWTIDYGGVQAVTSATGAGAENGAYFFKGDDLGQEVNSQMSQVTAVDPTIESDIDTGDVLYSFTFRHDSSAARDRLQVVLEFLDASDNVLDTYDTSQFILTANLSWTVAYTELLPVPALTRKVKITCTFIALYQTWNNGYIEDFNVGFYLDA